MLRDSVLSNSIRFQTTKRIWSKVLLLFAMLSCLLTGALAQEPDYKLGPEDVIVVTVLDQPQFSGEYLVPTSGQVEMPAVGTMQVAGLTVHEVQDAIQKKLKKRLIKPEVTVILKTPGAHRIYVVGDLRSPGVLDLKPGWSVSEAMTAAGGLGSGIEQRDVRVSLERNGVKQLEMPLTEALSEKRRSDFALQPGDVLRIETLPDSPVYVAGKVHAPGLYKMRFGETTVLNAIAQAGGLTEDADITAVQVVHLSGGKENVDLSPALLHGEKLAGATLEPGDMVLVTESQARIAVLGYVVKPGYYNIPSGQSYKLTDAIALAQGNQPRGRLSRVGVMRIQDGKEVRHVYDLGKYLTKGDINANPEIKAGDVIFVPETDRVDFGNVFSTLASTALILDRVRK